MHRLQICKPGVTLGTEWLIRKGQFALWPTVWLKPVTWLDREQQVLIPKSLHVRHDWKKLQKKTRCRLTFLAAIFSHISKTDWASDLWQLFEGPSQFEKPGNIAALWVILARASRLCIRGNSHVFFATALHQAQTKMSLLVWDHTFEARRMELNEEFGLARRLHNSLNSFQLNPGSLHACI